MEIKPALDKLYSLHQFGIKLGLESTLLLLDQIGNPHKKLKCFHIAGSNGKGSTASFIASILVEHGFKVGLYTSPHFVRFNERIKINGREISDEKIVQFISKLEKYIDECRPTFFELTTALAFEHFAEENVDYAVIETGLGGRLDATNVIDPLASVITSISLEHTTHLGNTIEKIAFEKAGIIKKKKPVFIGAVTQVAENVIIDKANEENSECYISKDFVVKNENHIAVKVKGNHFTIYNTPLLGDHQLMNAALAIKAVSETIENIKPLMVSRGIQKVLQNSKIEGRYEVFNDYPRIIFDSAHNPEGVGVFVEQFKKEYRNYEEKILIFGAMKDKSIGSMLSCLLPFFDQIIVTSIQDERAANPEEIKVLVDNPKIKAVDLDSAFKYLSDFLKTPKNACLVVLGSMYLLGEIKSKIIEKKLDIESGGV
ncbi:MAG: folylpolyglutamate synthase/dihydrofolate synthase family protein [Melioribacteraceae bacterium]